VLTAGRGSGCARTSPRSRRRGSATSSAADGAEDDGQLAVEGSRR
jgi:hypothetical protein